MKTFEQEYGELWAWFKAKTEEHVEAQRVDVANGLDGGLMYERHETVQEYNRRLLKLKTAHGKVLNQEESILWAKMTAS